MSSARIHRRLFSCVVGAALVGAAIPRTLAQDVPFLRGDANGDGVASVSDAFYTLSHILRDRPAPTCMSAADTDDDNMLTLTDGVYLLNHELLGGAAPPAPYPDPGLDPTPGENALPCGSYGGGSPLPDPGARFTVLDAVAAPDDEGVVTFHVAISSTRSIAGYGATIEPGVINDVSMGVDLTGKLDEGGSFLASSILREKVRIGVLLSLTEAVYIPPGTDLDVLMFTACIEPGTPPGEYPIEMISAELIDFETGRAIRATVESGTLTVVEAVPGEGPCFQGPPPPVTRPERLVFELESADAEPDRSVHVPFRITADAGVQGFSMSIDFDEDVLEATGVEETWEKPTGTPYGFSVYEMNNIRSVAGSGGVDEGFIVGAAVFDIERYVALPIDEPVEVLRLHFQVRPESTASATDLVFLDGAKSNGLSVVNRVSVSGKSWTPDLVTSFVFINGRVGVLPEITIFIRGDSNGDDVVDMADAIATLGFLFLGQEPPDCLDAADATDDGQLNIVDPVYTVNHLFLSGTAPPAPFPGEGEDPTPDPLGCRYWE